MQLNFELFESFKLFDWLVRKLNYYKRVNDGQHIDITQGQGRILAVLSMEDSLKTKELAVRVGMNTSSINEILSKMEKNGLIKRIPSKEDKRVIVNSLTQKAKECRPRLTFHFFDCLTTEQKETLLSIMKELNTNLQKRISCVCDDKFEADYLKRQDAINVLRSLNNSEREKEVEHHA